MYARIRAFAATGLTIYVVIRNASGQVWNGTSFVAYNGANWTTYAVTLTEMGATGYYDAAIPAGISTTGVYQYGARRRIGGSAATTDPVVWDDTFGVGTGFPATDANRAVTLTASERATLYAGIWEYDLRLPVASDSAGVTLYGLAGLPSGVNVTKFNGVNVTASGGIPTVSLVTNAVNGSTFASGFSLSAQNLTNAPTGSGGGGGLTTDQANQLTAVYKVSQTSVPG